MRHSLTPTAQDPDTSAFAGEPHFQGLSGDRRGAQDPWLSSPSLRCPLGDLTRGSRKAQAGGPEGSGLAWGGRGLGPTSQERCGQKPVCGAAVTRGGPRFGRSGSVRVSVLPGTQLSGLGCVGVGMRTGTPDPLFPVLRRKM